MTEEAQPLPLKWGCLIKLSPLIAFLLVFYIIGALQPEVKLTDDPQQIYDDKRIIKDDTNRDTIMLLPYRMDSFENTTEYDS